MAKPYYVTPRNRYLPPQATPKVARDAILTSPPTRDANINCAEKGQRLKEREKLGMSLRNV